MISHERRGLYPHEIPRWTFLDVSHEIPARLKREKKPRQTTALGAPKPSALQPPPEAGVASGWQWKKHEKTGISFDLTWKVVDLARKNVDLTRRSCGFNRI